MITTNHAHLVPTKLWKIRVFIGFLILFLLSSIKMYPVMREALRRLYISYSTYEINAQLNSSVLVNDNPAIAIPIFMYHGITEEADSANTTRDNFIAHMEMLKISGFHTINLNQLDLWLDGKIELPARPIVISFDDGRKDSYYPTDDILRKLGFSATIFEVTGKPNNYDPFYLSWNELRDMHSSGRWDIQAHGQHSHDRIQIDATGNIGRFLTSRKYILGNGLETENEFQIRILEDYLYNISDIKQHLGIDAQYYAIPLNEYVNDEIPSDTSALEFNDKVIRKYFRMAFIQQIVGEDVNNPTKDVYNYRDVDRYRIVRIEPMNSNAQNLKKLLLKQEPKPINLQLTTPQELSESITMQLYGNASPKVNYLEFSNQPEYDVVRALYGGSHWQNYSVETDIERISGKSAGVIVYYTDDKNYISLVMSDNSLNLIEIINGKEKLLAPEIMNKYLVNGRHKVQIKIINQKITVSIDKRRVFNSLSITAKRGYSGITLWDDASHSDAKVYSLSIQPSIPLK